MRATKYTVSGYGSVERVVGDAKSSGRVHIPIAWKDRKVMVILLDDPDIPVPPRPKKE